MARSGDVDEASCRSEADARALESRNRQPEGKATELQCLSEIIEKIESIDEPELAIDSGLAGIAALKGVAIASCCALSGRTAVVCRSRLASHADGPTGWTITLPEGVAERLHHGALRLTEKQCSLLKIASTEDGEEFNAKSAVCIPFTSRYKGGNLFFFADNRSASDLSETMGALLPATKAIVARVDSLCLVSELTAANRELERTVDLQTQKLAESEARFEQFFEGAPEYCYVLSGDGVILDVNSAALRALGCEKRELVGKPIRALYAAESQPQFEQNLRTMQANGAVMDVEMVVVSERRPPQTVRLTEVGIGNHDGKKDLLLVVQRDITERKRTQEALRRSQEHAQSLLLLAKDLGRSLSYDEVLKATLVQVRKVLDYRSVWLFMLREGGKEFDSLIVGDAVPGEPQTERTLRLPINGDRLLEELVDTREVVIVEDAAIDPRTDKEIVARFGNRTIVDVPILSSGMLIGALGTGTFGEEGVRAPGDLELEFLVSIAGHMAVALDRIRLLGLRGQLEGEVRKREQRLRTLLQNIPIFIVQYDMSLRRTYVNPAWEASTGLRSEDVVNLPAEASPPLPSSVDDDYGATLLEVLQTGESRRVEFAWTNVRGKTLQLDYTVVAERDDRGNMIGLLSVGSDITDRKEVEETLRSSERKYRLLAESSPEMIYLIEPDGVLSYINGRGAGEFGTDAEELVGKHLSAIFPPETAQRNLKAIQRVVTTGIASETEVVQEFPSGRKWVNTRLAPVFDDAGTVVAVLGLSTDISERKAIEEELREGERRYREFFEEDLTGDFISTVDGRILACNPAFARIYGFASVQEAQQANATSLYADPASRTRFIELLQRDRKLTYYEEEGHRIDGSTLHLVSNIIGIFDENDRLTHIKGYIFDDTERKLLEDRLNQAQKLESLGTLASGIAHDFNNILNIIVGESYLLRDAASESSHVIHRTEAIDQACRRGASLVSQLLAFGRKNASAPAAVSINEVVEEVKELLGATFPKTITISIDLEPGIPSLLGDATQLHQILLNLCVNARDAMPAGGIISIKTATASPAMLAERFPSASPQDYVLLTVADTGVGIDEELQETIFDPFFTSKSPGKGTGLGLAIVRSLVVQHRGMIAVDSSPGEGTTFTLCFPAAQPPPKKEPLSAAPRGDLSGGTETILLIEDEAAITEFLREILCSKGYRVLTAPDGEEGVALFAAHRNEIAVVLTDLGLPKLGGDEVARRILTADNGARVILASGAMPPSLEAEMKGIGVRRFVQKPYRMSELTATIRSVIQEGAGDPS